jgi:hypothetical protein
MQRTLDSSSDQLSNGSTAAARRTGADHNAVNNSCGVAASGAGLGTGPDAKPAHGRTPAGAPRFRSAYADSECALPASVVHPLTPGKQDLPMPLYRCCQIAHNRTLMPMSVVRSHA